MSHFKKSGWLILGWILTGLAFSFIGLAPVKVEAANNPPKIQVKAGFDSLYKKNSWLPLQVNLSLPEGNPNFTGYLEASWTNFASDSLRYRHYIELIPPVNRKVWLYLPSDNRGLTQVQFRLTASSGAVVESRDINLEALDQNSLLLGVLSDDPGALNYLSGERPSLPFNRGSVVFSDYTSLYGGRNSGNTTRISNQPAVRLAHLSPGDLPPEMAGWDSLDGLALTDLTVSQPGDRSLNQDNLTRAAAGWLAQGRLLVVAGESGLRRSAFLSGLLPVSAVNTAPQNVPFPAELRVFVTTDTVPEKVLLPESTPVDGATVDIRQANLPLLASRPFGLGMAWFLAPEMRSLPANTDLQIWRLMMQAYQPHFGYAETHRLAQDNYFDRWIYQVNPNLKLATLPNTGLVAGILLAYLAVVGPLGYFILKKLRKVEVVWLMVPVLAILMCAGLFLAGKFTSDEAMVFSRLSIVVAGETNTGKFSGGSHELATLYSSTQARFRLNTAEQSLSIPLEVTRVDPRNINFGANSVDPVTPENQFLNVEQGPTAGYGQVRLGLSEQHSFEVEQNSAAGIGEGIVAKVKASGLQLSGTLENRTGSDWQDLSIWRTGGLVYNIPKLQAGTSIGLDASQVAQPFNQLIYRLAGVDRRGLNGNTRSSQASSPGQNYPSQRVAVLATLLGRDGEALPPTADRLYLIAWKQSTTDFGLRVENQPVKANDLTLLFEPLVLK